MIAHSYSVLPEQLFQELFAGDVEMSGHIGENGRESPDAKRRVLGDRQMMLPMLIGGQSKVTAGLAGDGITELTKGLREIASGQIAGNLIQR